MRSNEYIKLLRTLYITFINSSCVNIAHHIIYCTLSSSSFLLIFFFFSYFFFVASGIVINSYTNHVHDICHRNDFRVVFVANRCAVCSYLWRDMSASLAISRRMVGFVMRFYIAYHIICMMDPMCSILLTIHIGMV